MPRVIGLGVPAACFGRLNLNGPDLHVAGQVGSSGNRHHHHEWFFAEELERAVRAAGHDVRVGSRRARACQRGQGCPGAQPNVMADLSARTPWIGPGTVLLRPSGLLDPGWSAVLNDFHDRFMVGLGLFAPAHYRAGYVNPMVAYYRALLGQLDPAVADMIGHANAERIAPFGVSG